MSSMPHCRTDIPPLEVKNRIEGKKLRTIPAVLLFHENEDLPTEEAKISLKCSLSVSPCRQLCNALECCMQPKGTLQTVFAFKNDCSQERLYCTWVVLVLLHCLCDARMDEPECLESSGVQILVCACHG